VAQKEVHATRNFTKSQSVYVKVLRRRVRAVEMLRIPLPPSNNRLDWSLIQGAVTLKLCQPYCYCSVKNRVKAGSLKSLLQRNAEACKITIFGTCCFLFTFASALHAKRRPKHIEC